MFKFIVVVAAVAAAAVNRAIVEVQALPGDITDAAETVHVPPEHRAAPPQPQQPQPPQFPGQPPFTRGAVFPPTIGGGGLPPPQFPPVVGGVQPQFPPLFFQTQNGFVPFASSYSAYRIQHATAAAVALPQQLEDAATTVVV